MTSNTNIADLPGGRFSVITFDQQIDVLLIALKVLIFRYLSLFIYYFHYFIIYLLVPKRNDFLLKKPSYPTLTLY